MPASPEIRRKNPNGLVPVLEDGDAVLWESNAICRYLACKHQRRDLLPDDPLARARVETWMDWAATDLNTAWRYPFMCLVRKDPRFPDAAAARDGGVRWNALMTILDAHLATTGPFAAGATFTLADIVLGLTAHRWMMTPIDHATLPNVRSWFDRLRQRPAAKAHLDPKYP
jgi:glutathione S-transferase